MAANCRNNVGGWPTREIAVPPGARGFAYYSIKDQAMVDAAEYGLMLWDGESKGTLNSVIKMVRQDKPVVVYLAPKKTFRNLRSADDVFEMLGTCDRANVQRLQRELGIERVLHRDSVLDARAGPRASRSLPPGARGRVPRTPLG